MNKNNEDIQSQQTLQWFPAHIQYGRSGINCNLRRKVFDSVKSCHYLLFYKFLYLSACFLCLQVRNNSSYWIQMYLSSQTPRSPWDFGTKGITIEYPTLQQPENYVCLCGGTCSTVQELLNAPHTHAILSLLHLCIGLHILVFENFYTLVSCHCFILLIPHWDKKV